MLRPSHVQSLGRVAPGFVLGPAIPGLGETGPRGRVSPRLAIRRDGLTLTELLVVIMIMTLLLATALPVMRTAVEDRAMREASRQLNTYLQLAKSQAAERGRPVGLWLETQALAEGIPTDARYCQQLFLAETPPPYGGDMVGATMKVFVNPDTSIPSPYFARAMDGLSPMLPNLVQPGDRIKFDFKGPAYLIDRVALVSGVPAVYFSFEPHQPEPRVFDAANPNLGLLHYQVFRTPQKSGVAPMSLTGGAVIDLSASGVGLTGRQFTGATTPIVIMFSPSGSVDRILGQGLPVIAPGTIHLLVGSLTDMMEEGVDSATFSEPYNRNLEVNANIWVSVGHQTGSVVTAQNAWEARGNFLASLGAAREFSERRFAAGGR